MLITQTEDIIVLAKAIPAVTKFHGQITCVAGITKDDSWRRLYPVSTRLLSQSYFMKFDIIRVEVDQWKGQHPRPEDRFLVDYKGRVDRISDWENRRAFLTKYLDSSVKAILDAGRSLGIIKPEIEDFYKDQAGRCRYRFQDASGSSHNFVCRDWETAALDRKYPNDFSKVRQKFCDWMKKRDTHFVIGTTTGNIAKMVVAVHYPPKRKAKSSKK